MARREHQLAVGGVPLFAGLDARERARVTDAAEVLDVPAGTEVVREGEPGQELYIVVAGSLAVRRRGRRLATLAPGDYFGELALLDGAVRSATVTTETDARLLALGPRAFSRALEDVPGLGPKLLVAMAGRLRAADRAALSH